MTPLGQPLQFLGRSLAAGERVHAMIDTPPPVADPVKPDALPASPHAPELSFEHVRFAYDEAEVNVLDDVSFTFSQAAALRWSAQAAQARAPSPVSRCASGTLERSDSPERAGYPRIARMISSASSAWSPRIPISSTTHSPQSAAGEARRDGRRDRSSVGQAQLTEFVRQVTRGLQDLGW